MVYGRIPPLIYRAMLRAIRNNTFCDTLGLQEKSWYEKIHTKYCKTVLGLKKTACNISTLSELGRLPIASFIKTQVMMYFVRINTNNINPLIKESLNVNKSLHRFSSRLPIYLYLKNKFITDPS